MDAGWDLYEGTEPYIFISYSHQDREQVFPVLRAMQKRGYRLWFDAGIPAGKPWTASLAEHIAPCAVFLPFFSPAFLVSPNCLQEARFVKKSHCVVPVWLEKVDRNDVPGELKFLLNNVQELHLDRFADADAFAAHLDREPAFRPCRAAPTVEHAAALCPAAVATGNTPAGPSPSFVGRTDRMTEIETAFRDGAAVVDLFGMGGIGKSEICRYLFQKYTDTGTDLAGQIGWVTWQGTLKETFYGQFPAIEETSAEHHWQLAQRYMRQAGRDLLMVLDNADTLQNAAELTRLGCRFLITSRQKIGYARPIPAGKLSDEECRILYRREWNDNSTLTDDTPEETLDKIIKLTAGHALTVKLLARTQLAAQLTAEELLEKLNESGFDLTGIDEEITYSHRPERDGDSEEYGKFIEIMSHIFDLSTLRNGSRDAAALRTLQGMSLLAPNVYIPMRTARKWLDLPNLNGLNRAAELGWLNTRTESGGVRFVSIHPVVAAVVRRTEPPDTELVDAVAGKLFEDMIPGTTEVFTKRLPVVEHAAALDRMAQVIRLQTGNYGKMLGTMGYLLTEQAEYDRSLAYQLRGVKIEETVLGTEHPSTAATYNNIAFVYKAQGAYDKALEWYQKALQIEETVLGTEHPSTATTYHNIAGVYRAQGDYAKALEGYQKALQIEETVLGTEHPETASTYNNIAGVYYAQGAYAKALEWYQKALKIRETVLGTEHPYTATTYHNIGTNYFEQGDYPEALKWLKKAVKIYLRVLGPNHPWTKITQKWISATQKRLSGGE